jgi:hypothetical protein
MRPVQEPVSRRSVTQPTDTTAFRAKRAVTPPLKGKKPGQLMDRILRRSRRAY